MFTKLTLTDLIPCTLVSSSLNFTVNRGRVQYCYPSTTHPIGGPGREMTHHSCALYQSLSALTVAGDTNSAASYIKISISSQVNVIKRDAQWKMSYVKNSKNWNTTEKMALKLKTFFLACKTWCSPCQHLANLQEPLFYHVTIDSINSYHNNIVQAIAVWIMTPPSYSLPLPMWTVQEAEGCPLVRLRYYLQ